MITVMRRYRRTLQVGLLLVIAAFVITSVWVFGAGSNGDRPDSIAVVNGESIPAERFERRYQAYLESYAQMYRGRFTPELAQQMGLPQQVVNDLVQEVVVVQQARTQGLAITDEELNAQFHQIPAFQENGRFSMKRYEAFLKSRGLTKSGFENDVRRQLTRAKVEGLVRAGIKVSEAEIEQAFVHRQESVRAAWALVELAPLMAAVTPTDDELKKYLDAHPDEFRLPERRRVQYVTFAPKDFTAVVSPAEIDKYYAEHVKEFETPHQVKAAHILVKAAEGAGAEVEAKARATAADAIRRARAGEDFAKLARELSEDPTSAQSGGDLGYVSRGEMVPAFEEALFTLKQGEVSPEPVRTPFGFHVIKVSDVKPGTRKPREAVAAQIRERLAGEAGERAARAKADEVKVALQSAKDFMAEARGHGLNAMETMVTRAARPVVPAGMDSIQETAFVLALGGVSAPLKTPAGWVVLKAVEAFPESVPALAEIKDRVAAAVKRQTAEAQALERAKQLVTAARAGDFAEAAKKAGAVTGETPRFTRSQPAEKLPGDAMVGALATPLNGVSEPVKTPQGYYVMKVLERVRPDPALLAAEREKIEREVMAQKQSQAWESWMAAARQGAKIEVSARFTPSRRS